MLHLVNHERLPAYVKHLGDVEIELAFCFALLIDIAELLTVQADERLDAGVEL